MYALQSTRNRRLPYIVRVGALVRFTDSIKDRTMVTFRANPTWLSKHSLDLPHRTVFLEGWKSSGKAVFSLLGLLLVFRLVEHESVEEATDEEEEPE